jgi:NAD-dependent deacetylase
MDDLIEKAAGIIREGKKILVFTGAGLSTESGIPDFRSPGGIWDRYDPQDFYYQRIVADESAREKYWKMSSEYYAVMKEARPNRAHLAVRELEDIGKLLAVVTQNIDSLHQRAGNSPDKIIEIHGTAFFVSCLSCGKRYGRDEIEERLQAGEKAPSCDSCRGILKPATVSFGQAMPESEMAEAIRCARECDVCMVLGSSLVVYPAASVPFHAAEEGARLVIVNRDPTPLDLQAEVVIHKSLGDTLTTIMERVRSFH